MAGRGIQSNEYPLPLPRLNTHNRLKLFLRDLNPLRRARRQKESSRSRRPFKANAPLTFREYLFRAETGPPACSCLQLRGGCTPRAASSGRRTTPRRCSKAAPGKMGPGPSKLRSDVSYTGRKGTETAPIHPVYNHTGLGSPPRFSDLRSRRSWVFRFPQV